MWLWAAQLHELGFKRQSNRYWRCERRFALPADAHVSLFAWSEQTHDGKCRVEFDAFYITFRVGVDHVHFYYHEHDLDVWEPGGNTSFPERDRLGADGVSLRRRADRIASAIVESLEAAAVRAKNRDTLFFYLYHKIVDFI